MLKQAEALAAIAIVLVLNLAFWGGLIYFTLWCLQHFGII